MNYLITNFVYVLQENLGGNSKTIMLATISPEMDCVDETLSTLRYACRARKITNTIIINEDPQLKVIRELREEVNFVKTIPLIFLKNSMNLKLLIFLG